MAGYNPASYEGERRDTNYKYSTEAATNAYSRFLSQQRGERSLGDMTTNFQKSYPAFGAQFNQRGLAGAGVNSGIQQQSMRNYVGDYTQAYGRGTQDLAQGLQQYDMNQDSMTAWRDNALADIANRQANAIAEAANTISSLQQYLGGS